MLAMTESKTLNSQKLDSTSFFLVAIKSGILFVYFELYNFEICRNPEVWSVVCRRKKRMLRSPLRFLTLKISDSQFSMAEDLNDS
jgi:hypothetical protein